MTTTLRIGQELHSDSIVYRIESVLGQGSFGVTYKAKAFTVMKGKFGEELVETNTPKAIKEFFMKEVNSRDESGSITGMSKGSLSYNYAQKFKKEAENLAGMSHPNIVKVIDFVTANNTFYYIMDYIEGDNLNEYLKRHKMSEKEAVETILEVAKALRYMHEEKSMLHLDLKPGNIMRRKSDGHIFLIDFGLSKHYNEDGQPDTSTTIGLGTEGYAPIEQGKKASAQNSFRPTIDVYALGGTLFKLLTGVTPPPASDILDDEEFKIMRTHGVNPHLQDVIIKAMLPSAKRRTASVAEFLKALKREEFSQSEEPIPIGVAHRVETPIESHFLQDVTEEIQEETVVEASSKPLTTDKTETSLGQRQHAEKLKELPTLSFIEAVKIAFQKNISLKGRSRRSEFIWLMILVMPVVILGVYYGQDVRNFTFIALLSLALLPVLLPVTVRRLHDINYSGWWAIPPVLLVVFNIYMVYVYNCDILYILRFFALLPVGQLETHEKFLGLLALFSSIVSAYILFLCIFKDGTNGDNKYGPSPKYH